MPFNWMLFRLERELISLLRWPRCIHKRRMIEIWNNRKGFHQKQLSCCSSSNRGWLQFSCPLEWGRSIVDNGSMHVYDEWKEFENNISWKEDESLNERRQHWGQLLFMMWNYCELSELRAENRWIEILKEKTTHFKLPSLSQEYFLTCNKPK